MEIRNSEAHILPSANQIANLIEAIKKEIDCISDGFPEYFSGRSNNYSYDFIIPISISERDKKAECLKIDMKHPHGSRIVIGENELKRDDDDVIHSLYYRVTKHNGESTIYRLSPFIHFTGDPFNPNFLLFDTRLANNVSFKAQGRTVFGEWTQANADNKDKKIEPLGNQIDTYVLGYKSLLKGIVSDKYIFAQYNNSKCSNSDYHEFYMIRERTFLYCDSICSAKNDLVELCKGKTYPYVVVVGNGGVGKTALVLSIIDSILSEADEKKRSRFGYDQIIFLSGKSQYITRNDEDKLMNAAYPSDVVDFYTFISKTHFYYKEDATNEESNNVSPDEMLDILNSNTDSKRTLLIIDDLDSFPLESQIQTLQFLQSLDSSKTNAIVTTRNFNTNGHRIELKSLDSNESLCFVEWYIGVKYGKANALLNRVKNDEIQIQKMHELTLGTPLFLSVWADLLIKGITPDTFRFSADYTQREITMYLYGTIIAQMSEFDKKVLRLIYSLTQALHADNLPIDLVYCFTHGATRDEFEAGITRLEKYHLVVLSEYRPIITLCQIRYDYLNIPPVEKEKSPFLAYVIEGRFLENIQFLQNYKETLVKCIELYTRDCTQSNKDCWLVFEKLIERKDDLSQDALNRSEGLLEKMHKESNVDIQLSLLVRDWSEMNFNYSNIKDSLNRALVSTDIDQRVLILLVEKIILAVENMLKKLQTEFEILSSDQIDAYEAEIRKILNETGSLIDIPLLQEERSRLKKWLNDVSLVSHEFFSS